MFAWFVHNLATIIISLVLIVILAGVIIVMVKDKRKGKSSCGGNCGCCPMGRSCHKH